VFAIEVGTSVGTMRTVFLILIWAFVFYVALDDSDFAWQHRRELGVWELNPLARWIGSELGVGALIGFKIAGLAFAFAIASYCRVRQRGLGRWLTLVAGAAYLFLFYHYSVNRLPTQGFYGAPPSRLEGAPPSIAARASIGSPLFVYPAGFFKKP
jgi:hypothetical protein